MKKKKQIKSNCPIGIFDSGLGGISVVKEVARLLPAESIIYFGDSANCPYGEKSIDEVIWLSEKITEFLIARNCKLIITACNTVTGLTIRHLREKYDRPFIGIEPAVKPAAQASKTGHIGVLATRNTFQSDHFINTRSQHASHVKVHEQPGIGLVEAVEKNLIDADSTKKLLEKYLNPMIGESIDSLVLGCTHYPFLEKKIRGMLPDRVKIYNPAPAIAERAQHVLAAN
ncbi:MAG: glutamate racemase, partial [Fidelibacterota bacterium]